ncbi:DUF1559 domain-containing protein [Bremerella cremea]|uniref:DUF1559 domain-containing protein n=2 Tax=Pirellulales TaxID=2691354 RepID=A0A2S8FEB3_9BACT|nr:hypothetical protein C5Y83_23110 [Blastopirellula marina]RCS43615.1 DUF1559 domain-containing protein [Bremerella cremea]
MSAKAIVLLVFTVVVLAVFSVMCGRPFLQWRERALRVACANQLKQIGMALHNYHDTYGVFPPAQMDGHSWRVRLMPFLEQSDYIERYRFDEPWNSPWNRELEIKPGPDKLGNMVGGEQATGIRYAVAYHHWQCPSDQDAASSHASYLMPVGPHAFGRKEGGLKWEDITDDTATTIAVAEIDSHEIEWLEPQDFDVETMSMLLNDPEQTSLSSHHPTGVWVVFCDGSVDGLSPDLPPEVLRAMITVDGGEKIVRDENAPGRYRLEEESTTDKSASSQP